VLAGYSRGNGAVDPGPTDLSAITVHDTGAAPLVLDGVAGDLPRLGQVFSVGVSGMNTSSVITLLVLGFVEASPPIDLGPLLGATGCNSYIDFITGPTSSLLNITLGAPATTFNIPVPGNVNLAGTVLMMQAVSDDPPANAFGFKFSNGGRAVVGI